MRVLIASGGTGGHIFPAISVVKEIRRRRPDTQFLFMGSTNEALKAFRFPACGARGGASRVVPLPAVGMPRTISMGLAPFAFRLLVSFDHSLRRVARFQPHLAVGFGNFGSVAPLLAAKARGIPVAIHEANAVPGRANLLLSRFSDKVLVNFPRAARYFPNGCADVVGMPLRTEFMEARDRLGALAKLNLSGTEFTLLVAGGSQGAEALNREVCSLLPTLQGIADNIQLIHLTGRSDYSWVRACYDRSSLRSYVVPFEPRMKILYDAADLIVARAGASTIAEIVQVGKPAILVPFPYATARHQDRNARCLEENNGAVVLRQRMSTSGRASIPGLLEKVTELIRDSRRLREMSANNCRLANGSAACKIVDVLFKIARPEAVVLRGIGRRVAVPA